MAIWNRHSVKVTHLGIMYDIIRPYELLTGPTKSDLAKFLNTIVQPEVWLSAVYWST